MSRKLLASFFIFFGFQISALAEEEVNLDIINHIRDEGFNHSQVMEILGYLTDDIGPRLTNSPQMREANQWTLEKFEEWGLKNATLFPFDFGFGWTFEKSHIFMVSPRHDQLYALPYSWSIGTGGPVTGKAILVNLESEEDLEEFDGDLEGMIVLIDEPRQWEVPSNEVFKRFSDEDLKEMSNYPIPEEGPSERRKKFLESMVFFGKLGAFFKDKGALAMVRISRRNGHMLEPSNYLYKPGSTFPVPMLNMASEHYNRIARMLEAGKEVELELDIATTFYDDDMNSYNTIAEIPGRGNNPQIVMVGAHLDSWFVGDGAVDNGSGSAVVMEAIRILSTLPDFKPKRTIRVGLWSGEEQGLFGSFHYVYETFASRPDSDDPDKFEFMRFRASTELWPIEVKPAHAKLAAYFNVDNGSGKIRGIYTEGNVAVGSIFEEWLKPFHDLGAETVITRPATGTDHEAFQAVGLPAYQFIQDPLDYRSRLHHTQLDTLDHVVPDDLKQAAVILAGFLYHAAMRDDPLPRKPLPKEPLGNDEEAE